MHLSGKCFRIRVNDTQHVAGVGLSLELNLHIRAMYGDLVPALFEGACDRLEVSAFSFATGVYMQVAHTYDPDQQKYILLEPEMRTNVELTVNYCKL